MRAWPWILGGGSAAAIAIWYWARREQVSRGAAVNRESASTSSAPTPRSDAMFRTEPLPGRWVWPVGVWRGRKPEISDGYRSQRRTPSGQLITHGGVDVMYRRRPEDPWRPGTPNGSLGFVMPDHRPALAASDGVVTFAASTPRGGTVIIDHAPRKVATYYTHFSSLLVHAGQQVRAGAPIGVIGADPLDGQRLAHLHFEAWRGGAADRFDPDPLMRASWEYLPDPGDRPVLVARNAQAERAHAARRPWCIEGADV